MSDDRPTTTHPNHLGDPPPSDPVQDLLDEDVRQRGYLANTTVLWAHLPDARRQLFDLFRTTVSAGELSYRQRAILIAATASTLGDSYCSLAWGSKLAADADPDTAAGVIRGEDGTLSETEQALARWARTMTADPNGTRTEDVDGLRAAGFTDRQIFAITVFVALRIAFSTVNAALGAPPDAALGAAAPTAVLDAVTFGRPIEPG